jgi:hypothetical protein
MDLVLKPAMPGDFERMTSTGEISTQAEWLAIRDEFPNKSSYREFRQRYHFNPASRIILTGRPIDEVVRADNVHRRRIYEECFAYGRTVAQVNEMAKKLPGQAEYDADLFMGLYEDLIRFFG